jgi:hypothetical protein
LILPGSRLASVTSSPTDLAFSVLLTSSTLGELATSVTGTKSRVLSYGMRG